MIIIEGGDNVGKTTLIKQLMEMDPSLALIKRDRFHPDRGETIATSYIRALLPDGSDRFDQRSGIMDRLLASECIYGDLFRGGCRLNTAEHLAVRLILSTYRAVIVHCDAHDMDITKTWTKRDQMYDDPLIIARSYRERIRSIFPEFTLISYRWTESQDYHRRRIIESHQQRNADADFIRRLSWWSALPHGIGCLYPRFVVIGEGLGNNHHQGVPFSDGPGAEFLCENLALLGPSITRRLYLTNAIKGTERDAAILRNELMTLGSNVDRIVLLGRESAKMFNYINVNTSARISEVPHPQFWRRRVTPGSWTRFRWPQNDEYLKLLKEALT